MISIATPTIILPTTEATISSKSASSTPQTLEPQIHRYLSQYYQNSWCIPRQTAVPQKSLPRASLLTSDDILEEKENTENKRKKNQRRKNHEEQKKALKSCREISEKIVAAPPQRSNHKKIPTVKAQDSANRLPELQLLRVLFLQNHRANGN